MQKQNKTIFLKYKYNFMEGERAKYVVQNFQILNGIYDPQKVHSSKDKAQTHYQACEMFHDLAPIHVRLTSCPSVGRYQELV